MGYSKLAWWQIKKPVFFAKNAVLMPAVAVGLVAVGLVAVGFTAAATSLRRICSAIAKLKFADGAAIGSPSGLVSTCATLYEDIGGRAVCLALRCRLAFQLRGTDATQSTMAAARHRSAIDMRNLSAWCAAHSVAFDMVDDESGLMACNVMLQGPAETPYAGGNFTVSIVLPKAFPIKSPSVGFQTPIWHPNIEAEKGSVCLDVINDKWTPITTLVSIVEIYLPELLRHPNGEDPLNATAAAMLRDDPAGYAEYVRLHTLKHAIGAADVVLPHVPYDSDGEHEDAAGEVDDEDDDDEEGDEDD